MPGSSNQYAYQLGQTNIIVAPAIGSNVQVIPPRGTNGLYFGYLSGGTLAVLNSSGASTTSGLVLGTTERIHIDGPATFFLGASGSTAICSVVFKYSAGFSALP